MISSDLPENTEINDVASSFKTTDFQTCFISFIDLISFDEFSLGEIIAYIKISGCADDINRFPAIIIKVNHRGAGVMSILFPDDVLDIS